ncbi:MAG: Gx transporter family protein [Candidatus Cloacimonetes bacterium]|nr:Gx transporter family protein [Candidatus Cloacimonadota bacterium]
MACIYIAENLVLRTLPVPFIRIGLSNVVILSLILSGKYLAAILINLIKSVIGGVVTFTLLTPSTWLSLGGGFFAVLLMSLLHYLHAGFSVYGISIAGAVVHNAIQLILVRIFLISNPSVMFLLPALTIIALLSGLMVGHLTLLSKDVFSGFIGGTEHDKVS